MIELLNWKLIEDIAFIDNSYLPAKNFTFLTIKKKKFLRPMRSDVLMHPAAPHPDLHILYFPEGI